MVDVVVEDAGDFVDDGNVELGDGGVVVEVVEVVVVDDDVVVAETGTTLNTFEIVGVVYVIPFLKPHNFSVSAEVYCDGMYPYMSYVPTE